ncbi:hypothetical protein Pfo_002526 [Paulownia fortunei]|nr:hypothetical protein Pfo_002526 [Paulownia fortunei]
MSSSNRAPARKSKGRQKLNMVKMENQSNLQVTYSKRRAGLFKKASELCTLCGAEAAMVVFSPADKVYCFGHPDAKTVLEKFAAGDAPMPTNATSQMIIEAHRNSTIRELNLELTQVESMLRTERRHGEELDLVRKAGQMQQWFPASFDDFNIAQLRVLKESIMGFKKNFDAKVQRDMLGPANPLPFYPPAGKKESPRGFPLGVEADISRVPTFNEAPLLLGSNDFSPYPNVAIGFSNSGLFAPGGTNNSSVAQASNDPMTTSNTALVSCDYQRASGLSGGAMYFVGGTDSSSSSRLPTDPKTIGNRGFGTSRGFNIGYDPRLF